MQFESDIEKVLNENHIDIFFTSGCIQYLQNPFFPINLVANSSIAIVAITRNNLSHSKKIYAEKSYLSRNGTGTHISKYENPTMYYQNTSINKGSLIKLFNTKGYSIVLDEIEKEGIKIPSNFGGNLIFVKSQAL